MIDINYIDIPRQFRDVHHVMIGGWLRDPRRNSYLNLVPREPLRAPMVGSPTTTQEAVHVVQLHCDCQRLWGADGPVGQVLTVTLTPGSKQIVGDWCKRHEKTRQGQFDWHPFRATA